MGQLYNGKLIKSAIFVGLEISAYVAWKDNSGKYNSYDSNNYPLKNIDILKKEINMLGGLEFFTFTR